MIIFKGENFQKAWIPHDMDKNWQWTSNSKGWTCDIITLEWITCVFDPETCAKANGKQRAWSAMGMEAMSNQKFFDFVSITRFPCF